MSKKEKKMNNVLTDEAVLDIPEDEIYTYQIEGLAPPHIGKPYKNYRLKKIIFAAVIIVAVSLSMYFSLKILETDVFTFTQTEDGNYQFSKFSNPGYIEELTIDYVLDITYPSTAAEITPVEKADAPVLTGEKLKTKDELADFQAKQVAAEEYEAYLNAKPTTSFQLVEDKTKLVTSIKAYAINGDGYIKVIHIGANVTDIDGKAFYSCWALQRIEVDENNPNYCDIDGVLYTKDKKTVVCYPCDRDAYLREKYNYPKELWANSIPTDKNGTALMSEEEYNTVFEEYKELVMTYAIPDSVISVGELCFNYSNLATVYLPSGLKEIGNLGFFEMPNMKDFYTYFGTEENTGTDYESVKDCEYIISLPDGLEIIGTDAFSFNKCMDYIFIPASVKQIGHHAFWDSCYSEGGEIKGLSKLCVEQSEEEFKESTETGDQWVPIYDSNLLKKIPVEYSAQRKTVE